MICAYITATLYVLLLLKVPIININTYNIVRNIVHKLNYILESVLGSMQTRHVYLYIVYRLIIAKHAVYAGLKF